MRRFWWTEVRAAYPIREIPVSATMAMNSLAQSLPRNDSADRIVVATACELGASLVTADEVGDVNSLHMVARVNGEVWCDSSTSTMHWKIPDLIAHASLEEELTPGELWGSGTVGDGSGAERGVFLKRGDVVELEIERVGTLRNRVV